MMAGAQKPDWAHDIEVLVKHDLAAKRNEYLFPLPWPFRQACVKLLRDPRDEPLLNLLFNVLLLAAVPATCLFGFNCRSHMLGLVYLLANYALFLQRFMLTLHFSEHRRLFKDRFNVLNQITPLALCTLYGIPTGLYRLHHCVMHHVEGNSSPLDLSSTEPFQRDRLTHFLQYWCKFWLGSWTQLPQYALKTGRHAVLAKSVTTELAYLTAVRLLWQYNHVATLWVLVLPFLVSSLALMFGNWSQHIFVDPEHPDDPYRSTYNCIAAADNQRTYNDGYHVLHHLNSQLHWRDMPQQFLATLAKHEEHDALVFRTIHFFDVGLAVFTGRLAWLAEHVVPCGPRQAARSKQQWVELMRRRLEPVSRPAGGKAGRGKAGKAQ